MLRQEVNLYQSFAAPLPAANFLTWKRYLLSQVFFLIILLLLYFGSILEMAYLEHKKLAALNSENQLKTEFYKTKSQYPQLFFTPDVNQAITDLQNQLDAQTKILHSLRLSSTLSQTLLALSKNTVSAVWLTKIYISNTNGKIVLHGKSNSLSSLQQLISNLSHEKMLSGYTISLNNIQSENAKKQNGTSDFELQLMKRSSP